jgi:hypothetical protein
MNENIIINPWMNKQDLYVCFGCGENFRLKANYTLHIKRCPYYYNKNNDVKKN